MKALKYRLGGVALAITGVVAGLTSMNGPAAATSLTGLEGVHHYDHVVVLTEENESEATTFGAASPATYLNSLVPSGVFLPNYYGTGHVSLDNYLAMVSGQPNNGLANTDCAVVSLWTCATVASLFNGGQQLGDQLEAAGLSWNSWMDGTSTPCFHANYSALDLTPDPYQGNSAVAPAYNYADRHNPFIYFSDFVGNQARCVQHQRPFSELTSALAGGPTSWTNTTLPQFSFITPDTCHDGHDSPCAGGNGPGGLASLDAFLQSNLPSLLQYLNTHNGLLIINFDESAIPPNTGICLSCAGLGLGGQTGALLLGAGLTPGKVDAGSYDHYSLLRTIEDTFGISTHLGLASNAAPITGDFTTP